MSDYHRSYVNVHMRLGMKGHGRVNHKRRFVEGTMDIPGVSPMLGITVPNSPGVRRVKVHTNAIERAWRDMKNYFRTCSSLRQAPKYVGEYLYRRNILRRCPTLGGKIPEETTNMKH